MNFRRIVFASIIAVTAVSSVYAQTADEIINKYITAIGGRDAWHGLNTIHMEGFVTSQGTKIPISSTTINKKAMRQEFTVSGMTGYQIVTTTQGWAFAPFAGQKAPEAMPPDQVKSQQDQLDIQGELLDYKTKGEIIEYLGKEDVDGTDCYKLKVSKKNGNVSSVFIDPSNNYLIRVMTKATVGGQEHESVMNFSNFHSLDKGLVFPMSIDGDMGEVKFTKIDINPKVDESIFNEPSSEPKK